MNEDFVTKNDDIISKEIRTIRGIKTYDKGMDGFWIGTVASSESIKVMTSSDNSSSPTCRLPSSLIDNTKTKYIITVLAKIVAIFSPKNINYIDIIE